MATIIRKHKDVSNGTRAEMQKELQARTLVGIYNVLDKARYIDSIVWNINDKVTRDLVEAYAEGLYQKIKVDGLLQ